MIFSIVVSFWNNGSHIERCVRSLLEQDFDRKEYEIIFIDNNSTDGSADIVRRFPGVILLEERRGKANAARNKGIKIARGGAIAFTDPDCAVAGNWLSQIRREMEENGTEIVMGKRLFPSPKSSQLQMLEDYENTKIEYILNRCARKYFYGYANNLAIRSDIFKKLGFFDERLLSGDTDFIQRYCSSCQDPKIAYLPEMQVTHLEIDSVRTCFQKMGAHGRNNIPVAGKTAYRGLNYGQKFQVYEHAARNNSYTSGEKALFLLLLALGDLTYQKSRIMR